MTISNVQHRVSQGTTANLGTAWTSTPVSGNLLIITVAGGNGLSTNETVTTPANWTAIAAAVTVTGSPVANRGLGQIFYRKADGTASDNAPTIAFNTNNRGIVDLQEWSSTAGWSTNPISVVYTADSGSTGTSPTDGSATTPANCLVVAALCSVNSSQTVTWGGGMTQQTAITTQGTVNFSDATQITSSSGAIQPQCTLGSAGTAYVLVSAAFRDQSPLTQALTGALSFTGSQNMATGKGISGAMSFTGALPRVIGTHLSAALSFTGSRRVAIIKSLAAAGQSFTGAVASTRVLLKSLSGALSFTGSQTRATGKGISAGLSFTGAQARSIGTHLTGALSFTGTLVFGKHISQALSAVLSFTGTQTRSIGTHLSGGLSFTGSRSVTVAKGVSGALSFTGSQVRSIGKRVSGALSFTGSRNVAIVKGVSSALSFTGALTRAISSHLTGALSFTGSLAKRTARALSGAVSFAGAVAHNAVTQKNLTAALSFTGSLTRQTGKGLSGVLSFTGHQAKAIATHLTGGVSFTGAAQRMIRVSRSAALSFTGVLQHGVVRFVNLNGALSFTGTVTRGFAKSFTASLSFSASQVKAVAVHLVGAIAPSGALRRAIFVTHTGSVGFTGSITKAIDKSMTAAMNFSGRLPFPIRQLLTGALSFVGTLVAQTRATVTKVVTTFDVSVPPNYSRTPVVRNGFMADLPPIILGQDWQAVSTSVDQNGNALPIVAGSAVMEWRVGPVETSQGVVRFDTTGSALGLAVISNNVITFTLPRANSTTLWPQTCYYDVWADFGGSIGRLCLATGQIQLLPHVSVLS